LQNNVKLNDFSEIVMFSSKISKQPGESNLVASLIVRNTLSKFWAHWKAGLIVVIVFGITSSEWSTSFYWFLTPSIAFLIALSASIQRSISVQ
jgi:hypothetical protein